MPYRYTLGVACKKLQVIEATIQRMEQAMRHASPATVDVLQRNKQYLDTTFKYLLDLDVQSNINLNALLSAYKKCLHNCVDHSYRGKHEFIGRTRRV